MSQTLRKRQAPEHPFEPEVYDDLYHWKDEFRGQSFTWKCIWFSTSLLAGVSYGYFMGKTEGILYMYCICYYFIKRNSLYTFSIHFYLYFSL